MLPIYFTPYISAQVEEPRTFESPLETPIKPKKIKAIRGWLKKYIKIKPINNGILMKKINFRLENLSTKKPDKINVIIEAVE